VDIISSSCALPILLTSLTIRTLNFYMAVYFQFLVLLIVLASHCALSLNFVLDHTARIQFLLSCSVIGSSFVLATTVEWHFALLLIVLFMALRIGYCCSLLVQSRVHVLGICRIPE